MLNLLYEQTIFSPGAKPNDDESVEDNFNLIHDSALGISILKPLLKPKVVTTLLAELKTHASKVLKDRLQTFDHSDESALHAVKETTQAETSTLIVGDDDDDELPWLKKSAASSTKRTSPGRERQSRTKEPTATVEATQNVATQGQKLVGRRLKRTLSEFHKELKTHIPRNASRTEMLDMAKSISDLVVDCGKDGATIASVLTLLINYEACWERFPKDAESLKIAPYDKITS